jgi:hypothetical protein
VRDDHQVIDLDLLHAWVDKLNPERFTVRIERLTAHGVKWSYGPAGRGADAFTPDGHIPPPVPDDQLPRWHATIAFLPKPCECCQTEPKPRYWYSGHGRTARAALLEAFYALKRSPVNEVKAALQLPA